MIDEPQNDIPNENEEQKPDDVRFDYDMIQYRLKTGQEVARFRTDYAERYGDEDLPPEYVDPTSKPVEDEDVSSLESELNSFYDERAADYRNSRTSESVADFRDELNRYKTVYEREFETNYTIPQSAVPAMAYGKDDISNTDPGLESENVNQFDSQNPALRAYTEDQVEAKLASDAANVNYANSAAGYFSAFDAQSNVEALASLYGSKMGEVTDAFAPFHPESNSQGE